MKLAIPYKLTGDNGIELKFALRSMQKYFKDLSGCVLIGDKPTWYIGDHIPAKDVEGKKEFSIYSKLAMAKDQVLFTNDDIFALQPFDSNLPNFYWDICANYGGKDMTYINMYRNCPGYWLNFDVHSPMVMDTRLLPEWDADRPLKTYYGNHNKLTGIEFADCKFRYEQPAEIKERIRDRLFFSTHSAFPEIVKVLNELYPKPSIYEKIL